MPGIRLSWKSGRGVSTPEGVGAPEIMESWNCSSLVRRAELKEVVSNKALLGTTGMYELNMSCSSRMLDTVFHRDIGQNLVTGPAYAGFNDACDAPTRRQRIGLMTTSFLC